ncbi:AI-2E family transporter [Pseudonocardia kunmingensis]|uniref:AI-2E family transporter n=1 Tax=Pseudonocardia kunmingensis TaxID=630975 RepID=UPI001FE2A46F|nr:AI-2E family transporter [Pseudonocardia kunmingensis]
MTSSTGPTAAPTAAPGSPRWPLPRGLIVLLALAAMVVVIGGLRAFAEILGPVFLALMLTVAVHPLMARLRRAGAPTWLAVAVTLLATFLIVLGLAAALALSVAQLATLLPTYQDRFAGLVQGLVAWLNGLGVGAEQVRTALDGVDFAALAGLLAGMLLGLAGAFSNLVFILAVLLFMGLDAASFPARMRAVGGSRPDVAVAFASFARGTRSYLLVSTVFGLIVAVLDGVALWWMGVPLAVLWGLLAFITNYIPNIGFIIGLVPPALLALLEGGPQLMLLVIVVYVIINFIIQSVIQPKYVGDAVDMSLTLTFLSLVIWAWIIGPLGALLAIPLTLLTKALLLDIDPHTRWMTSLVTMGAPADPRPEQAPPGPGTDVEAERSPGTPPVTGSPSPG